MRSSPTKRIWLSALLMVVFGAAGFARAQAGARVDNWTVPEDSFKATDISRPVTFVAVTPCRIVDTRGPAGPHGGPALQAGTQRNFALYSGPCAGIPFFVAAFSLNFTVTQTQGPGDLRAWPAGGPPPLVSTLNYVGNQTIANAAIVPWGSQASISVVAAVSGTHLIIDINGYFTGQPNDGNSLDFTVRSVGWAMRVGNFQNSASESHGILAFTNSTGAHSFGIVGQGSGSGETGGVLGIDGGFFSAPSYGPAGVRGQSIHSLGILGVSVLSYGVGGSNISGLTEQTWGGLGCTDTVGVCGGGNLSISGSKSFVEPHPSDARRVIKYVSLEGNEAGTYFRGRARFERGLARILVPEDFRMVTDAEGLSIQVTPIGEMASVAVVRIDLNEIVVKGSRSVEFFYLVQGMRKGYEDFVPIVEEEFFVPRSADYRMPGAFSPEAKRKLIANGTYKADGTVNMETARRLGWTEKWKGGGVPKTE